MNLKFKREELTSGYSRMTVDYMPEITEQIEIKVIKRIIDEVANDWVETHGAKLLEKITPEEVERAVKKNLAERVLKS